MISKEYDLKYSLDNEEITQTHITLNKNIPKDFTSILNKKLNLDLEYMNDTETFNISTVAAKKSDRDSSCISDSDSDVEDEKSAVEKVEIDSVCNSSSLSPSSSSSVIRYETNGYFENTIYKYKNIPEDFSVVFYKKLNPDLLYMSDTEAMIHYETTGYFENRIYKYDMNYNFYVYCCGKCGSSTLYKSLKTIGYNVIHVHNNYYYLNFLNESKQNPNLYNIIDESMSNNDNVYFIDVFRTPFERKMSSYFQNNTILDKTLQEILDEINNQIFHVENYISINEILDYFNLTHFDSFDFEKKYNLIKYKNAHIIKLRFKDIKEWDVILSNILKKDIKIINNNLSENKEYAKIYKEIKSIIKLNKELIDFF